MAYNAKTGKFEADEKPSDFATYGSNSSGGTNFNQVIQATTNRGQAPSPVAPVTRTPTLSEAFANNPTANERAMSEAGNFFRNEGTQELPTEESLFQNRLRLSQAEIDATNRVYADILGKTQQVGRQNVGSTGARNARAGLLGSERGAAIDTATNEYNLEQEQMVDNERNTKIQSILGRARSGAVQELAEKRAAKTAGYDKYIAYLSGSEERNKNKLTGLAQSLLAKNIDLSTATDDELNKLALSYNVSKDDLFSSYRSAKAVDDKAKAETEASKLKALQNSQFSLSEGQSRYDASGKVIASGPAKKAGNVYGGYDEEQNKKITSIDDKISKNETYKKTSNMRSYADNVSTSLSLQTGTGDLAAINQFQKVIDEGAVTRDQDVKLIQSSQSLINTLGTKIKGLTKGEQLSPALRSQMKAAVDGLYKAQIEALAKDPFINSKKLELERYGISVDDTIIGELGAYSVGGNTVNPQNSSNAEEKAFIDSKYGAGTYDKEYGGGLTSVGGDTNKASSIASAIKKVESSGNYQARGGSGEFGAYQFMPNTWREWAGKYAGNPNLKPTPENQDFIANAKISELIKKGHTPQQIALIWNGGEPKIKKGVNKYGVAYDSGAYANKVLKELG